MKKLFVIFVIISSILMTVVSGGPVAKAKADPDPGSHSGERYGGFGGYGGHNSGSNERYGGYGGYGGHRPNYGGKL